MTDTLVLDQKSFAHWACSISMTLFPWSLKFAYVGTLVLYGLNGDELLPDLDITRAGVLRAGIGAHPNMVDQDAQAADRKGFLLRLFRWPRGRYRFTQGRVHCCHKWL